MTVCQPMNGFFFLLYSSTQRLPLPQAGAERGALGGYSTPMTGGPCAGRVSSYTPGLGPSASPLDWRICTGSQTSWHTNYPFLPRSRVRLLLRVEYGCREKSHLLLRLVEVPRLGGQTQQ